MKVIVTIDTDTREGQEAFNFIKKMKAPEKSIAIQKERKIKIRKLTDEEMALPGPPPSREELEAWLAEPDDGPTYSAEEVVEYVRKSLARKRKTDKKGK